VNFLDTWNKGKWSLRTLPARVNGQELDLAALSCLSVSYCEMIGATAPASTSPGLYAGAWNGKRLTQQKLPLVGRSAGRLLTSIACATKTLCVATGLQMAKLGELGLRETWNGTAWTSSTVAPPKGKTSTALSGASCPTKRSCIAVGEASSITAAGATAINGLASYYNGKTWTAQRVPSLGTDKRFTLGGISCPAATACVAIGQVAPTVSATPRTAAWYWNGISWRASAA
jgi:hypothetical protein